MYLYQVQSESDKGSRLIMLERVALLGTVSLKTTFCAYRNCSNLDPKKSGPTTSPKRSRHRALLGRLTLSFTLSDHREIDSPRPCHTRSKKPAIPPSDFILKFGLKCIFSPLSISLGLFHMRGLLDILTSFNYCM